MILGRQAVFIVIAWKQEESSNRQWDITVGAQFGLSESQFSSLEEHINTGTDSSILLVISFAKIFECEAADNHDKSDSNYMYDKYNLVFLTEQNFVTITKLQELDDNNVKQGILLIQKIYLQQDFVIEIQTFNLSDNLVRPWA